LPLITPEEFLKIDEDVCVEVNQSIRRTFDSLMDLHLSAKDQVVLMLNSERNRILLKNYFS
jgi:hypothetical protein